IAELERNADKIVKVTGYKPKYYRSGFAFYDPQGAKIAQELGYKIVDGVLGDRIGFYSPEDIKAKIVSAEPGAIIMVHMNHPERKEAEVVIAAIEELKSKGFRFVKLSDYNLN
ncbi:MAG TPA: polysaccharide deacetylase, partial [Candidatus Omnitrophota bacterium]|nr:polysaccharide deacetylase [Candidatus Omnitrophota bacterium]